MATITMAIKPCQPIVDAVTTMEMINEVNASKMITRMTNRTISRSIGGRPLIHVTPSPLG